MVTKKTTAVKAKGSTSTSGKAVKKLPVKAEAKGRCRLKAPDLKAPLKANGKAARVETKLTIPKAAVAPVAARAARSRPAASRSRPKSN